MVKWFCTSALCFNNYRSKDSNGQSLKFYRLPRDKNVQLEYSKIFHTKSINWTQGHICVAHWSTNRENSADLPDIIIPENQYEIICEKYTKAKRTFELYKSPSNKLRNQLKNAKRKYEVATKIMATTPKTSRNLVKRDMSLLSTLKKREFSKKQFKKHLDNSTNEISNLKIELAEANATITQLKDELQSTKNELAKIKSVNINLKKRISNLETKIATIKKKEFKYTNLIKKPGLFQYLCGLSIEQFNIILNCAIPYIHLIPYPDCMGVSHMRSTDISTELLAVLVICRHGLHQGIMAYILEKSKTTMQRIFIGWVIFLATLFNQIDLKPASGFLLKKMPKSFVETCHGLTDLVIDATEFKFQSASNFELNSLMFSNYKNTQTGKALIGVSPHGSGILFSDIYPGSISDSEITEKSGAILFVEEEHEIMSDRGFSIQEFCASKSITLNRPKQKESNQFAEVDVASNFDIAATRIHVERYIGRIRCWGIMNCVWPINRMDILSSTWQMIGHIVNLTMPPIGPKE